MSLLISLAFHFILYVKSMEVRHSSIALTIVLITLFNLLLSVGLLKTVKGILFPVEYSLTISAAVIEWSGDGKIVGVVLGRLAKVELVSDWDCRRLRLWDLEGNVFEVPTLCLPDMRKVSMYLQEFCEGTNINLIVIG